MRDVEPLGENRKRPIGEGFGQKGVAHDARIMPDARAVAACYAVASSVKRVRGWAVDRRNRISIDYNRDPAFMTLDDLRARLNQLDKQLLELVAQRQAIVADIGRVKLDTGAGTRDFKREREVLTRARDNAAAAGVSPDLGEALLKLLIRGSLTTQEQARVAAQGKGSGRTALLIGGAGKMGRWFASFLTSQGFRVIVADPAGGVEGYEHVADWRTDALDEDIIVVATPIKLSNLILTELAARKPRGVVFDIGSLKTPLRQGLTALQTAGCKVTSVHPMFGPDTELLSGRHVIFIDLGSEEALREARNIFASTMAQQVTMSLDEHDRLIAYVLGLSHALNIAFFTALAESGEAAPRLAALSSTTYDAQADIAEKVSNESPDLYFEIQNLNEYGRESLQALRDAVERIWNAVTRSDPKDFTAMMLQGRDYLAGRVKER
jgi:chorismate mutase/prephenate dehydrogenase